MKQTDKLISKLEKSSIFKELIIFFLCIAIFGGIFNFLAISNNDCLMPVKYAEDVSDYKHSTYINNSEVNYPIFTDKFPIKLFQHAIIFSIGDIFIFLGAICVITFSVIDMVITFRIKKMKKRLRLK